MPQSLNDVLLIVWKNPMIFSLKHLAPIACQVRIRSLKNGILYCKRKYHDDNIEKFCKLFQVTSEWRKDVNMIPIINFPKKTVLIYKSHRLSEKTEFVPMKFFKL